MHTRDILFREETRDRLMMGIEKLNDVVRITLGPDGENVILDRLYSVPISTKDGVTVAREVFLEDRVENAAAQLLKQVASKSARMAGDGTTTATILGHGLFKEGLKALRGSVNSVKLRKGIKLAVAAVVSNLKKNSTPIKDYDDLFNIARISSNDDKEIGKLVADAFTHAGRDGEVNFIKGNRDKTELNITDGICFDSGFIDPIFINNFQNQTVEYKGKIRIVFHENPFDTEEKFGKLVRKIVAKDSPADDMPPTLIIADNLGQAVLPYAARNNQSGKFPMCFVKAPSFHQKRRELLDDMALITGGKLIPTIEGNEFNKIFELDQMGYATHVIISKDRTLIMGGAGDPKAIQERKEQLTAYLNELTDKELPNEEEIAHIRQRLANFNGLALIAVGGNTEAEMHERYFRVEDAVHATKAALEEGILPGGGTALIRSMDCLNDLLKDVTLDDDVRFGVKVVKTILSSPCRQIAINAGVSADAVVAAIEGEKLYQYGYDAATETFGNMIDKGIIDPTKVVRCALENANSIADVLLTTGATISMRDQEGAARAFPAMGYA